MCTWRQSCKHRSLSVYKLGPLEQGVKDCQDPTTTCPMTKRKAKPRGGRVPGSKARQKRGNLLAQLALALGRRRCAISRRVQHSTKRVCSRCARAAVPADPACHFRVNGLKRAGMTIVYGRYAPILERAARWSPSRACGWDGIAVGPAIPRSLATAANTRCRSWARGARRGR
jgi:hypothetical protein